MREGGLVSGGWDEGRWIGEWGWDEGRWIGE